MRLSLATAKPWDGTSKTRIVAGSSPSVILQGAQKTHKASGCDQGWLSPQGRPSLLGCAYLPSYPCRSFCPSRQRVGNSTRLGVVRSRNSGGKAHPTIAAVGSPPTVLAIGHIGSAVCCVGSAENRLGSAENCIGPEVPTAGSSQGVVPGEVGTDLVGGRGVEDVDRRDGSSLSPVVGYLCPHRTWKSLAFRVSLRGKVQANIPSLVTVEEREKDKALAGRTKEGTLLLVVLLHPAWWQRASICGGGKHGVPNTTWAGCTWICGSCLGHTTVRRRRRHDSDQGESMRDGLAQPWTFYKNCGTPDPSPNPVDTCRLCYRSGPRAHTQACAAP